MSFFKEHTIKLAGSEKEYKLILKIEENDNNYIHFYLNDKLKENYYSKYTLSEMNEINSYFGILGTIINCANTLSNIIKNSNPKLKIKGNDAELEIAIFLPGQEKKSAKIILEKVNNESNENIIYIQKELTQLKTKVNDLQLLLNQKDLIINEIKTNYDNLKKELELLKEQHQTDYVNLKSLIPQQNVINNNFNPNLRTFQEQQAVNNNEQSLIITNNLELNFLSNKFRLIYPGKNVIYNLLYRKSRDGDQASIFHLKCDRIRGTMVVIKTEDGLKFGGYTNETWEGNNIHKKDNTAFIFSINYNKAYNIKNNNNAIYCSPKYGPFFSGNNNCANILINDNSNINGGECCKAIDSNYDGYLSDYEINNNQKYFRIKEYEVWKVTIV